MTSKPVSNDPFEHYFYNRVQLADHMVAFFNLPLLTERCKGFLGQLNLELLFQIGSSLHTSFLACVTYSVIHSRQINTRS